jgi:hypothetical protein
LEFPVAKKPPTKKAPPARPVPPIVGGMPAGPSAPAAMPKKGAKAMPMKKVPKKR